jgi:leader peptidase (prepilin peptidase)/N-methyltransferase
VLAARVGWSWELVAVLALVPLGVALLVIDVRTRYLPTRLIAPGYVLVPLVAAFAAWQRAEWAPLLDTALGWLLYGGFFTVLWLLFPAGALGYGDVRLAGMLGMLLGLVNLAAVPFGMFAGAACAALWGLVGAVVLHKRHHPFGPGMLVGAALTVLVGPAFGQWAWG